MANNKKAKIKVLYLLKILQEETNAEHGLTMSQIIERLDAYGIPAERKSIYSDLDILREFDIDIKTYQRNPVEYAIERRDFSIGELMLMVDAIQSCRAITRKNKQRRSSPYQAACYQPRKAFARSTHPCRAAHQIAE